jgi:hypothetical protein
VFTRPLHWSLSRARSIQSISPNPIFLRSILKLSSHLRLGLPSGLFHSGIPTKILYIFLLAPMRATCPVHLILLNLIILIILGEHTSYEVPRYAVFSNLLSLHPSSVKISDSAPGSQTPSV